MWEGGTEGGGRRERERRGGGNGDKINQTEAVRRYCNIAYMHWLGEIRKEGGRADQTNPSRNIKLVPGSTDKESLDSIGTFSCFNIKLVPGSTDKESLDSIVTFHFNIKLVPAVLTKKVLTHSAPFRVSI